MATFRNRDGKWQAIVRKQGHVATKTFSRKQDAQLWATAEERKADLGEHAPSDDHTLGQLIERYEGLWNEKKWGHTKAHTLVVLNRDLGKYKVSQLTARRITDYISSYDASPASRNGRLATLKEVLKTAKDLWDRGIDLRPVDEASSALRRQRTVGPSTQRSRRPTAEELQGIVSFADGRTQGHVDLGAVVSILSVLPFRLSELTGIQWDDLNEKNRSVILRGRKHPDFRVKQSRVDEIPLPTLFGFDTYAAIAGRPRYFPSPFPYKSPSVTAAFRFATHELRIDGLRLHDLRAYATSRLLEANIPIPQVALLTGHRDWKTLARHYSRMSIAAAHLSFERTNG